MRHFWKAAGLTALAMTAAMALFGASDASASVACKTNTTPCGSIYPAGTATTASLKTGTKLTFAAGFAVIECKESAVKGEITEAGSSVLTVKWIFPISFGSCATGQTVTVNHDPHVVAHWEAGTMFGNFTLTEASYSVKVGSTECTYGGTVSTGIKGESGEAAAIKFTNAPFEKLAGGILCANPAKFNAEYSVTSPKAIYFAES